LQNTDTPDMSSQTGIALYQLDIFADRLFAGNPAAVCPLDRWLPDALLQQIAAENNLSETAYFVADDSGEADFLLRWFTPTVEVELCGHATLASGHVLLETLAWPQARVRFRTLKAGVLQVERRDGALWLDLPAQPAAPLTAIPAGLPEALGAQPVQVLDHGGHWVVVYDSARTIEGLRPDFAALRRLAATSVCVTAPGRRRSEDFVSRFFAPVIGIDEDPVTGSAHCRLLPYWAARIGRNELRAAQLSARGGLLQCRLEGGRAWLSGPVQPYLQGHLSLPASGP